MSRLDLPLALTSLPSPITCSVCKSQKLYLGEKEKYSADTICVVPFRAAQSGTLSARSSTKSAAEASATLPPSPFESCWEEKSKQKNPSFCPAHRQRCGEGWAAETPAQPWEHNKDREGKTGIPLCFSALQSWQSHGPSTPHRLLQLTGDFCAGGRFAGLASCINEQIK